MTYAAFCADRDPQGDPGNQMRQASWRLASGPARIVLVTLEDLWLEREPQNVPGTTSDERPNWRRKMSRRWPEITTAEDVLSVLREVERRRKCDSGLAVEPTR